MLKKGFTLSEVLITLGIIGVVAAMTLPVLISRYQERQWTTAYLRVYSLLENAYRMAQNEHGTFENWAGVTLSVSENDGGTDRSMADGMAIYNTMIKPYLKLNDVSFSYGVNDDYESTCENYRDDSLYIELRATKSRGDMITHEIPLTLDDNCSNSTSS